MKKIFFLLGIYMSMGFTTTENNNGAATSEPQYKQILPSNGYIEATSPDTYVIVLN